MLVVLRLAHAALRRLLMLLFRRFLGSQDRVQGVAFLTGAKLYDALFADVFDQAFQDLTSQVGARHLATTEENRRFDFVSLVEKAQHVVLFSFVIVVIHIDAELYFLDYDHFLMLLGLAFLLLLLIQEFPVVHDAAYRRRGCGRNLDQIQVLLAGHFQGFKRRQDADLLAFVINHADFAGSDAVIGADKTFVDTILRR